MDDGSCELGCDWLSPCDFGCEVKVVGDVLCVFVCVCVCLSCVSVVCMECGAFLCVV